MTPHEIAVIRALGACRFLPGSSEKRFVRQIVELADHEPDRLLSDRQWAYIETLAWRFRRQMPPRLVPASKPGPLPEKPQRERRRKPAAAPIAPVDDNPHLRIHGPLWDIDLQGLEG